MFRILIVTGPRLLQNPMCGNWINGLSNLGYSTTCLYEQSVELTYEQLRDWGISDESPTRHFSNVVSELDRQFIISSLKGEPDIIFCWEGVPTLKPLRRTKQAFPNAKVIVLIDTYPNAPHLLSELSHILRYSASNPWVDGYIFYSKAMCDLFYRNVFGAKNKPYLSLIEPFLGHAFSVEDANPPQHLRLERLDKQPHIIFTGNAENLWSTRYKEQRDALGPFLSKLAEAGVHVFVNHNADLKNVENLHVYPPFSNQDLLEGRFAQYISQFDAHLLIYNECNGTLRRRVASGLSTRLAFSLTSVCPIVVSETSQFIHEYWKDEPFGFMFKNVDDLVESLRDSQKLSVLRANMERVRRSFSFEVQSDRIHQLFKDVMTVSS